MINDIQIIFGASYFDVAFDIDNFLKYWKYCIFCFKVLGTAIQFKTHNNISNL